MPQYLSPGVYVEEIGSGSRPIEGVGTAVAAFVGLAEKGPTDEPILVTNWTQFSSTFGDFIPGSYLAHAVYGYFLNGGGICYVIRVGGRSGAATSGPVARAELTSGGENPLSAYRVTALEAGPAGNAVTVDVAPPEEGAAEDTFKIIVRVNGDVQEEFGDVTTRKGRRNAVTVVNTQSKLIRIEETADAGALARPATGSVSLSGGAAPEAVPAQLNAEDYVGDAADRTGFASLEAIDAVTMLAVPDLMAAFQQGMIDIDGVQEVQLAMIAHCERMGDRVAIIDPPPNHNAQQILDWRMDKAGYDSKQAALYWPWVRVADPVTSRNILIPPSGHVAGVWARNDDTRGVHKAPANEVIRGVLGLELNITKGEQDLLNPDGVNCIRSFPGRGTRIWGARTLSSDPAWRYLNVRRLFNYLEKSILNGTDWVVFEPNDEALWAKLRRTISSFLLTEWRKGALFGATPGEAFYVKCDAETNPIEGIDLGQVVCQIGVAPVKPAEFIIFRLSQYSAGSELAE